jgi:hypothetical protein
MVTTLGMYGPRARKKMRIINLHHEMGCNWEKIPIFEVQFSEKIDWGVSNCGCKGQFDYIGIKLVVEI